MIIVFFGIVGIILLLPAIVTASLVSNLVDSSNLYQFGQFDISPSVLSEGTSQNLQDEGASFSSPLLLTGGLTHTYTVYNSYLTQSSHIDSGDIENDGFADLVSSSYFDGAIAIFHQNSTLHELELVAIWDVTEGGYGNGVADVYIRDMNDDCRNDIVVFDVLNRLIAIFQQTDEFGVFVRTQYDIQLPPFPNFYSRGGVGDLNNDGLDDLIWTTQGYAYVAYQLSGGGGFTDAQVFPGYTSSQLLNDSAAEDVSGDGLADLIIADGYWDFLMVWEAPNWDLTILESPDNVAYELEVKDLDGDGFADIVQPGGGTDEVWITWGGSYTHTILTGVGNMEDAVIADFDDDGDFDLAATDKGDYQLVVWTFNGRNTVSQILDGYVTPGKLTAADLNGDGLTDAAYGLAGYTSPPHSPVTVHYQVGEGEIEPQFPPCAPPTPTPGPTLSPTPTPLPTLTPTLYITTTATLTHTPTSSLTLTLPPSITATPTLTQMPNSSPTLTPIYSPTATSSPTPPSLYVIYLPVAIRNYP